MKRDYETAVEEFEKADEIYKQKQAEFYERHAAELETLRAALEERNAKLTAAKHNLRAAVQLGESQWRGPEGAHSRILCGPFEVKSVTRRSFDQKSLFTLCQKHGILDKLLKLKGISKDDKEYSLVEENWKVDYKAVYDWLKQNELEEIIAGAYNEEESTPRVEGKEKLLTFLGDKKES